MLRKLKVVVTIDAQAADDSALAPLVFNALREFMEAAPQTLSGKFESKDGLDVSWEVSNQYLDDAGNPMRMPVAQAVNDAVMEKR